MRILPRVVFVPGIMGSVLRNPAVARGIDGKDINREVLRRHRAFFIALALANPIAAEALRRAILAADMRVIWGLLDMLPWMLVPDLWKTELLRGDGQYSAGGVIATDLLDLRVVAPYKDFLNCLAPKADVLVFPYDWRLSNDVAARDLEGAIQRKWWPRGLPPKIDPSDRVTIIAHSMGGLVSRHLMESRNGHRFIKRLITGGTPHIGAPKAYTDYHGVTLPFEKVIGNSTVTAMLGTVSPSLPTVMAALPSSVRIPFLMPAAMQIELIQSYSSALQLLPIYDFVRLPSGAMEPVSATYGPTPAAFAPMKHKPTGHSIPSVMNLMRHGMETATTIDAWLGPRGVKYDLIASSGLTTVQGYDVKARAAISNNFGDSTVPKLSAHFASGSNIGTWTFSNVDHQGLFKEQAVQDLCLRLLGLPECGTRIASRESESAYEIEAVLQEVPA